ncbi:hypothetical protein ABPG77_003517 [Micractinium sp. CCAP 211/92]
MLGSPRPSPLPTDKQNPVRRRLGLPFVKLTLPARRQQQGCSFTAPPRCAGVGRLIICQAASPQPSSPGSQPPGSGAPPWTELLAVVGTQNAMLQKMQTTQRKQGRALNALQRTQRKMQTTQRKQGRDIDALKRTQRDMQTTQEEQGSALDGLKNAQKETAGKVTAVQKTIRSVQAAQTTQGNTVGAYAEKFVRVERVLRRQDLELRRNVEITTVAGLLRFCSVGDKLASREQLLRGLMGSTAFSDLLNVVKKMMEDEAKELGALLPAFPSSSPSLSELQEWLKQSRNILMKARKSADMAAWLPACKGLEEYAEAAGASTDALLAALEKSDKLVLMLLAALATGQLFEMLELDGEPVVRLTDEGMELDLLEIKATEKGINQGVEQVKAHANILLHALALSNPWVLQQGLRVVGTVQLAVGDVMQQRQTTIGGTGLVPEDTMKVLIVS